MIPERKLSSSAPGEARRKHVYCSSCELRTSPGLPHSLRMQTSGTRLLRSCTQFERCPASGQHNNYCTGIYLITALRGKFRLSAACLFPGIRRLRGSGLMLPPLQLAGALEISRRGTARGPWSRAIGYRHLLGPPPGQTGPPRRSISPPEASYIHRSNIGSMQKLIPVLSWEECVVPIG